MLKYDKYYAINNNQRKLSFPIILIKGMNYTNLFIGLNKNSINFYFYFRLTIRLSLNVLGSTIYDLK